MSEWYENFKKEKVKRIVNRGESHHEMDLYCPYCGYKEEEIWENFDLTPNGEEVEGQCNSCERYFFYSVDLSFSTRKSK